MENPNDFQGCMGHSTSPTGVKLGKHDVGEAHSNPLVGCSKSRRGGTVKPLFEKLQRSGGHRVTPLRSMSTRVWQFLSLFSSAHGAHSTDGDG